MQFFCGLLHEGKGADRLAAIFVIGHNPALAEATDLLLPFLTSSDLLERCAAACMFALRRDERAFPILEEYLCVEPDDVYGYYPTEARVWYASYRSRIAHLLGTWGPSSVVPVLRRSFLNLWRREEKYGVVGSESSTDDALCYALGRRGALSAFHGIGLPAQRRRLALMYMTLGYVQADERFENLRSEVLLNSALQQELATVLADHFALSEEEIKETVHSFGDDIEEREHASYGIDEEDSGQEVFLDGTLQQEVAMVISHHFVPSQEEKEAIARSLGIEIAEEETALSRKDEEEKVESNRDKRSKRMSRWGEYSLEKTFSGDEYYFMPRYSRHVAQAFVAVWFEEPYDILGEAPPYQYWIEKALQDFEKRWGSTG